MSRVVSFISGTCVVDGSFNSGNNRVSFGKKRSEVEFLNFPDSYYIELEGELNLKDFTNLKSLDCANQKISILDLSNCSKLKSLSIDVSELTSLDLSHNPELTSIKIRHSRKLKANLNMFSHLTKLEILDIYGSNFQGSLQALQNCSKLKHLNIGRNSEIKEGLEYLPITNSTKFDCQGTSYESYLKPYGDFKYPTVAVASSVAVGTEDETPEQELNRLRIENQRLKNQNILLLEQTAENKTEITKKRKQRSPN
ncbi:4696_t:CDS:2 [Entrophospora sp. SA101]|nr:4696_t:CDS:2 [Entrophospora sp. SA101]